MHSCSRKVSTGDFQRGDCKNPTKLSTTQSSAIFKLFVAKGEVGGARLQPRLHAGWIMEYKTFPPPENASSLPPAEARALFRQNGYYGTTAGFCFGYSQANLLVLPESLADDFERFCKVNSAPFPLLYRSKVGDCSAPPLAKDSDVK